MFEALGSLTYRRRREVLALAAAFLAVALGWGTGVFGSLSSGGFSTPGSGSARAAAQADAAFGGSGADVVLLYRHPGLTVADPAFRSAVEGSLAALPGHYVERASTYWSTDAPALVSTDRHATYAVLDLVGSDEDARGAAYEAVADSLAQAPPGFTVQRGGTVPVFEDISTQVSEDLARAEMLSLPVVLVLLVVVFGGLAAASLPLAIGGLAILGSLTVLRLLTLVTEVSIFSINLVTMLGLGLAIDYALFIVSRFREELAAGSPVEQALRRTMATAGRTIAFSGLTVAIALAALLLFPQGFLRSMGFGGIAAVLVAMVGALTVLPALLAVLGPRVDALRIPLPRRRSSRATGTGRGAWERIARGVMRRPVLYVAVLVPLLLAAGTPFLRAELGAADARVLPAGTESRVVSETIDRDFATGTTPYEALVTFPEGRGVDPGALAAYADRLAGLPGVSGADVVSVAGGTAQVNVVHGLDPDSAPARELVSVVRAVPGPEGASVSVGGASAELVDLLDSLDATLPLAALLVVSVTLVLLFFAFGSAVLPVKAVLANVLSLGAAFGAVVWIFQDGNLGGLLDFTTTGTLDAAEPIVMLAIAFGLSMDYEVFLLSRIREEWDRTGDNALAVARGLQRSGGIITSAALLLVVVFAAFATSGIVFIKMIGVGMVIAILVDATVVRALLVPATMRLLGRANWWAPGPLARLYSRFGFREDDGPVDPRTSPAAEPALAAR